MECLDLSKDNTINNKNTSNLWKKMANMNFGGSKISVCTFNGRYILKVSN